MVWPLLFGDFASTLKVIVSQRSTHVVEVTHLGQINAGVQNVLSQFRRSTRPNKKLPNDQFLSISATDLINYCLA